MTERSQVSCAVAVARTYSLSREITRAKTAGPVGRVLFALAMKVFTKLSKPEKMAWMFDYHIKWDAPVAPAAPVSAQLQTA